MIKFTFVYLAKGYGLVIYAVIWIISVITNNADIVACVNSTLIYRLTTTCCYDICKAHGIKNEY